MKKPCIFCSNPRTNKKGEHLWDNWLNREDGRKIVDPSTTSYYGYGGRHIRSHGSTGLNVTIPVTCDRCNNEWMNEVSSLFRERLTESIRRDKPVRLDAYDLTVVTMYAFMKSAVLDWQEEPPGRRPCISRRACLAFRRGLVADPSGVNLPDGLQVFIARYQRTRRMEASATTDELSGVRHFKGYRVLLVTYVVGSFIFQLLYPRWSRQTRKRPEPPFFFKRQDRLSIPIWPNVTSANWPPFDSVTQATLGDFRQRFRRGASIAPP